MGGIVSRNFNKTELNKTELRKSLIVESTDSYIGEYVVSQVTPSIDIRPAQLVKNTNDICYVNDAEKEKFISRELDIIGLPGFSTFSGWPSKSIVHSGWM
jgi:hypothetical protein